MIESVQPKIDKTLYKIKAYEGKKIYLKEKSRQYIFMTSF